MYVCSMYEIRLFEAGKQGLYGAECGAEWSGISSKFFGARAECGAEWSGIISKFFGAERSALRKKPELYKPWLKINNFQAH